MEVVSGTEIRFLECIGSTVKNILLGEHCCFLKYYSFPKLLMKLKFQIHNYIFFNPLWIINGLVCFSVIVDKISFVNKRLGNFDAK